MSRSAGSGMSGSWERITWSNTTWLTRLHYSARHMEGRQFWADPAAVQVDPKTGYLHLLTHRNPMAFPTGFPQIGAGLLASNNEFGYGTFEICCQLPQGKWLWPAFWGVSKTWPPEVDMFEGYSDGKGSYRAFQWWKPCAPWAIRTNAYYGYGGGGHKQLGAKQHSAMKGDPSKRFEYYKLEWTPGAMKIFFGLKCVRQITHKELLADFKREKLVIVLNNGIRNEAKDIHTMQPSDFVIKYFSYKPL